MIKKSLFICLAFAILLFTFGSGLAAEYDVDTGFRPGTDGFSFPNYGSRVCSSYWACTPVQNLTAAEMHRMFGDRVCKTIYADGSCALLKVAESWMGQVNQTMSGGHCEGMAVLSSLFFSDLANPSDFGGRSAHNLQLDNNTQLQRELAYWFATQWFMDGHLIENDPTTQLKILVQAFQDEPNRPIPIGIYKRNMTGGHAITAYAVEERGNGIYWIMVYDNNYPNEERYITVNPRRNSWTYETATMAGLSQDVYDGSGRTNPFQIAPVDARLGTFDCEFCPPGSKPSRSPAVPPAEPVSPASPAQPSDSEGSIYDILIPWLFPDMAQPTAIPERPKPATPTPEVGGESIFDILMPWLFPDMIQPTATQPAAPAPIKPTATPAPVPSQPDDATQAKTYNKLFVNKDVNIYIETDANQRSGYDWQDGNTYDEIPGVSVNKSVFRSSARIPNNKKYYLWINSPDAEAGNEAFYAEISSPGTILKLNNVLASYTEPNFVYSPPNQNSSSGVKYEAFEIMADAGELPQIEFTISDENGEYNFLFLTEMTKRGSASVPVDFVIYHDYEYSQIGIWITTANKQDLSSYRNAEFEVNGEFYLWDNQSERYVKTEKAPVVMAINGMFFFNYANWLDGSGYFISADLNGNGDFETWREIR